MRRLNVVWVVIAPCRSHTLGLDVVGDHILAVGKRPVTDSAVSLLRRDFLSEHFTQFRGMSEVLGILWDDSGRRCAGLLLSGVQP
jgi:hypothetical protein